jgi:hypothetical protein
MAAQKGEQMLQRPFISKRASRGIQVRTRRRVVAGALGALSLFVLLSACDNGRPVNEPRVACMVPGDHCEYDDQCCSHRCYHDTGCAGGRP